MPRAVRARIAELAGAEVASEAPATTGFSPGYASAARAGRRHRGVRQGGLARAEPRLPRPRPRRDPGAAGSSAGVPAPGCSGRTTTAPGSCWASRRSPGTSRTTRGAPTSSSRPRRGRPPRARRDPCPGGLPPLATGARRAGREPARTGRRARRPRPGRGGGRRGRRRGSPSTWRTWSAGPSRRAALAVGDHLAHNDLRADNILLGEHDAWVVDWPHACRDAPAWYDLAGLLVSIAMQGGGDPDELFWSHPTAAGADRDVRARRPRGARRLLPAGRRATAPLGIGNLRPFQLAQGSRALAGCGASDRRYGCGSAEQATQLGGGLRQHRRAGPRRCRGRRSRRSARQHRC